MKLSEDMTAVAKMLSLMIKDSHEGRGRYGCTWYLDRA
jgi:hypothetical protein